MVPLCSEILALKLTRRMKRIKFLRRSLRARRQKSRMVTQDVLGTDRDVVFDGGISISEPYHGWGRLCQE